MPLISGTKWEVAKPKSIREVMELPVWRRALRRLKAKPPPNIAPPRRPPPAYVQSCRKRTMAFVKGSETWVCSYRCKSWRCPQCRRALGATWFERMKSAGEVAPFTHTGTLTNKAGPGECPDDAEKRVGESWSAVIREVRRKLMRGPSNHEEFGNVAAERKKMGSLGGGAGQYVKFLEWTCKGMVHVHFVMRDLPEHFWKAKKVKDPSAGFGFRWEWERHELTDKILTRWVKDIGAKHEFGWQNELEEMRDPAKMTSYLTTHVLKAYQLRPDYLRGLRRITRSRGALLGDDLAEKEPCLAWDWLEKPIERVEEEIKADGGEVFDLKGDVLVDEQGLPESCALSSFRIMWLGGGPDPGAAVSDSTEKLWRLIEKAQYHYERLERVGELVPARAPPGPVGR